MGQVKIWLNSQPDIREIPKFLLLIMIIITVFFMITTLVIKESFFNGFLALFLHIKLESRLCFNGIFLHCGTCYSTL